MTNSHVDTRMVCLAISLILVAAPGCGSSSGTGSSADVPSLSTVTGIKGKATLEICGGGAPPPPGSPPPACQESPYTGTFIVHKCIDTGCWNPIEVATDANGNYEVEVDFVSMGSYWIHTDPANLNIHFSGFVAPTQNQILQFDFKISGLAP